MIGRVVALVILAIGLALLAWMVAFEGEPGALPLLLVAVGGGGYVAARRRWQRGNAGSA